LLLEEEDKQSLDGAWFLSLDKKENKQTHLDTTSKMSKKTKRLVITLEDTINMAMSQPSLQICDKGMGFTTLEELNVECVEA